MSVVRELAEKAHMSDNMVVSKLRHYLLTTTELIANVAGSTLRGFGFIFVEVL